MPPHTQPPQLSKSQKDNHAMRLSLISSAVGFGLFFFAWVVHIILWQAVVFSIFAFAAARDEVSLPKRIFALCISGLLFVVIVPTFLYSMEFYIFL